MAHEATNGFGRLVGGRPCLDFVNTVGGRAARPGRARVREWYDHVLRERLPDWDALLAWSVLAGTVPKGAASRLRDVASGNAREADRVYARAFALREATYRLLRASQEGWHPDAADVATLNDELRSARMHQRLAGDPPFAWVWDEGDALERVLWPLAVDAAALLTDPDALARIGQCPGDECGWLFLDTSRAGRRKWCDMADCGNAAKVRRFRERQAGV